jgi:hypothetical protein
VLTLENLFQHAKADLESYARSRNDAVARGAETPSLAALLVQKYGYGLAKALKLAAELSDHPAPELTSEVDRQVEAIDPHWRTNFELRINARPAALLLTAAVPDVDG